MGAGGHGDMGTWEPGGNRAWGMGASAHAQDRLHPRSCAPYAPMPLCPYVPMSLCRLCALCPLRLCAYARMRFLSSSIRSGPVKWSVSMPRRRAPSMFSDAVVDEQRVRGRDAEAIEGDLVDLRRRASRSRRRMRSRRRRSGPTSGRSMSSRASTSRMPFDRTAVRIACGAGRRPAATSLRETTSRMRRRRR